MGDGKGPSPFDMTGPAHKVSAHWEKWKRSFKYFVEGPGITDKKCLRSLQLHHAGVSVQGRFETLKEDGSEGDVYKRAVSAMDASFDHKPRKRFERCQLRLM